MTALNKLKSHATTLSDYIDAHARWHQLSNVGFPLNNKNTLLNVTGAGVFCGMRTWSGIDLISIYIDGKHYEVNNNLKMLHPFSVAPVGSAGSHLIDHHTGGLWMPFKKSCVVQARLSAYTDLYYII